FLALRPADLDGVPGDVDVAADIRRQGAAAVERGGGLHEVALVFEDGAGAIEPGVEHRRCVLTLALGLGLAGAVPGDMDPAALAQRDLSAADGAGGDGAARLA